MKGIGYDCQEKEDCLIYGENRICAGEYKAHNGKIYGLTNTGGETNCYLPKIKKLMHLGGCLEEKLE